MQLNGRFFGLLYLVSMATASANDGVALSECRKIGDSLERLVCYDALADRMQTTRSADIASGPAPQTAVVPATPAVAPMPESPGAAPVPDTRVASATPAPVATTPAADAPTSGTPVVLPDAEVLFGRSETEIRDIAIESSGQQSLDRLESTVTSIVSLGNGRMRYTLENGQQWQQVERERFQVSVGQAVEVRRASLGSFFMKKVGKNRSTRVKRVD